MPIFKLALLSLAIGNAPTAPLESVYAVHRDRTGITVQVRSNGCTDATSFFVRLTETADGTAMALERRRQDMCRGFFREGTTVRWTWSELGIEHPDTLTLVNPVAER